MILCRRTKIYAKQSGPGPQTAGLGPRYFVPASRPASIDGNNSTYFAQLIPLHLIDLTTIIREHKPQNCSLRQKKATVKKLQPISEHGRCSIHWKFLICLILRKKLWNKYFLLSFVGSINYDINFEMFVLEYKTSAGEQFDLK